jgi:glycine/D-amino acid oxidase-like deaminating enzyme
MKSRSSILIVGAGIFGVTTALGLRRRGYAVSLFDPGPLPHTDAASTDISKVIRMDYGADDFYMDLMEAAFAGWEAWNADWPRPLYHQTGMVYLSSRGLAPGEFEFESFVRLEQRGVPVERVDQQLIRQKFPAWSSAHDLDGYYNPRAGWAESAQVVARLLGEAKASGVLLYEGQTFAGLIASGSRVDGIITRDGSRFLADAVILTAGSWTPVLLPHLSHVMWPVGQPVFHFVAENVRDYQPPQFPVWGLDVHIAGWYGFPARDGGILKVANHGPGWRMDPNGPRVVPASEEGRFREFFRRFLPGLASAPLAYTRLCFYCDTFDGDFWIDHDPDRQGLLVCAGDSGHAFKFAPVLGSIIADVLEHKPNRYARRFAWRQPEGDGGGKKAPRK